MIGYQIFDNSCDKNHFFKAVPDYNIALKESGINNNVKHITNQSQRQTEKTNIIWPNSPYSANAKTNVGKIFTIMVDKHFLRHYKHYKPFNRSNIKLSCSCMRSMNNVIREHNSKIMKEPAPPTTKTCFFVFKSIFSL